MSYDTADMLASAIRAALSASGLGMPRSFWGTLLEKAYEHYRSGTTDDDCEECREFHVILREETEKR